ncbi:MAG: hypothetical protein O7D86_11385 [Proteobacteria bacterium]|nr:hypothetical protein [Pseudomonadota bacterium]
MEKVESRREHDSRDGGGRVAPGAATEQPSEVPHVKRAIKWGGPKQIDLGT